ncbi:SDR family NAD(P)-dependent oxidoreductase [Magnetovibrio sp.]|uniref:SDR family NAD(P)-dependent oxidoreductase n=1 Tax=Magnetovibrio sp. TaxID=2024836 RepID=UPI002F95E4A7
MRGPLSNKTALVTGAAGGIGLMAARALAQTGCSLHMVGQKFMPIEQAASDIRSDFGVNAEAHTGNLAISVDAEAIAMACADAEIYINCTGNLPSGALEDIEDEAWRKSWEAAVFAPLNMVREMIGHMTDEGRGLIVLVIDAPAKTVSDDICASASGAVLKTIVEGLSQDLAQGVRILGLCTERNIDANRLSEAITRLAIDPGRFATGSLITAQDAITDDEDNA